MASTKDETRILHQIEADLRREDHWFPAHFTFIRTRAALHHTSARVVLCIEAALSILIALAAWADWPALLIPAIGIALAAPIVTFSLRTAPPGPDDPGPQNPWNPWPL